MSEKISLDSSVDKNKSQGVFRVVHPGYRRDLL